MHNVEETQGGLTKQDSVFATLLLFAMVLIPVVVGLRCNTVDRSEFRTVMAQQSSDNSNP